jgi:hypothetical protein
MRKNEIETGDEKPVRMTIYIKPSVIEKLRADARKDQRIAGHHAGVVIEKYYNGKDGK